MRSRFLESDGTRTRRTRVAQARTQATGEYLRDYLGSRKLPSETSCESVDQSSRERGPKRAPRVFMGGMLEVCRKDRQIRQKSIATR